MKTRKPLADLIPDIITYFHNYKEQLQFDLELYRMHEGQIKNKVEESLAQEIISRSAFRRAIQRIPSINIPKKITDKLSKVYAEAPARFSTVDLDIIEKFANKMDVNSVMNHANKMSNLNKRCAIEIYTEENQQYARVLNAYQFFVFSDSKTSPNKHTVFCKLLGKEQKYVDSVATRNGKRQDIKREITYVEIMALYSDTEILIIDSDGSIRTDKMAQMGIKSSQNPFGTIPFIYVNKSMTELIPYPNQTAFDMGILIPKLLTDLNYSAQFLSHSIVYTTNTDVENAELNPDSVINLGDTTPEGHVPTIGTIDPNTDIDGILKLIEFELGAYLTTEGLKAGNIGQLQGDSAASGISKIIDESDATEARKQQTELFMRVEKEFWEKFAKIQQIWSKDGAVESKETFSPDFIESFSVKFAEIKPLESEKEKYDKIKVARDLKLITKKQALKELFPNLSDDQIEQRLEELDEELSKEKEEMLSMGLTPGFTQLSRQQEGVSDQKLADKQNGTESDNSN